MDLLLPVGWGAAAVRAWCLDVACGEHGLVSWMLPSCETIWLLRQQAYPRAYRTGERMTFSCILLKYTVHQQVGLGDGVLLYVPRHPSDHKPASDWHYFFVRGLSESLVLLGLACQRQEAVYISTELFSCVPSSSSFMGFGSF